jgi:hypothetical protein
MTSASTYNNYSSDKTGSLNLENKKVDKSNIEGYNTSNYLDSKISYFRVLPTNINIFRNAQGQSKISTDILLNKAVIAFLLKFQELLVFIKNSSDISNNLPPLQINSVEDEAIIIEWIFKDFRIGFDFEKGKMEINWYLVTNKNVEEHSSSGSVTYENSEQLLKQLIFFVLSNT